MPKKTENYQLNQYEPQDSFLRTDFNEDNAKIDAALAGLAEDKSQLVFGHYAGNGTVNRTISLGFTPKAVLLMSWKGTSYNGMDTYGGLMTPEWPIKCGGAGNYVAAQIVAGGFRVSYDHNNYNRTNDSSYTFYYMAVR